MRGRKLRFTCLLHQGKVASVDVIPAVVFSLIPRVLVKLVASKILADEFGSVFVVLGASVEAFLLRQIH
jgi:hypothetical protein